MIEAMFLRQPVARLHRRNDPLQRRDRII